MTTITSAHHEVREFRNQFGHNVTLHSVKTIASTNTRPDDTNTYASGDVLNESTSAGEVLTFADCAYRNGGEGVITKAKIIDSANQSSLYPRFELFIFSVAPAAQNDNAAFAVTDAELLNLVGVIPFSTSYAAGANSVHMSDNLHIPFNCAAADADLYGVLVLRNAYVPIAEEVFKVVLDIL